MIKLLLLKSVLVAVSIFTLTYASVQTKNLGHLNLQPGATVKFYSTSLTGREDYYSRPNYFKNKEFLSDGELIGQQIVTSFEIFHVAYGTQFLFDFTTEPTWKNFVFEFRGYLKAPQDGNFWLSQYMESAYTCNGDYGAQFQGSYYIIKEAIYLNDTSDGFVCTYDSDLKNHKEFTFDEYCPPEPFYMQYNSDSFNMSFISNQYYPIVFYTYISGEALSSWGLSLSYETSEVDYPFSYQLENYLYYDPNEDSERDDANLNAQFPDSCPQFHDVTFTTTQFIEPSAIYFDCPPRPTSSFGLPSEASSIILTSSGESSSSFPSSSSSSSIYVQSSSSELSNSFSYSSYRSSRSSSYFPSSSNESSISSTSSSLKSSSNSIYSSIESEVESVSSSSPNTKTSFVSESVTSSFSDTGLKSSLSSTAGKPIYTANSTVSHSEHTIPTSESTAMASSSSFTSETADGNGILSTATITESEIDTLTTTTCPETEQPPNTGKTNPSLTSCEETVLPSQESLSNEVTKTAVGPGGVIVTYTECAGSTALQENSFGASGENSKLSTDTVDNAAPAHSTDMVTVDESALVFGEPALYSSRSTAVAVQALPDEGRFLTYEPLLLGLSILITFL